MAFKREYLENSLPDQGETSSPLEHERIGDNSSEAKTYDSKQIHKQYEYDSNSSNGEISTGAVIPRDMTVRLVRADSYFWEILINILNTFSLTLFGLFLGAWISKSENSVKEFSILEIVATFFFLFLSVLFTVIWIFIKVNQSKKGVRIPQEILTNLGGN